MVLAEVCGPDDDLEDLKDEASEGFASRLHFGFGFAACAFAAQLRRASSTTLPRRRQEFT